MRLPLPDRPALFQACALAGMALVAGLFSNLAAGRQRQLGWLDSPTPASVAIRTDTVIAPLPTPPAPPATTQNRIPKKAAVAHPSIQPGAPQPVPGFPPDPANPVREISGAEAWQAFRGKVAFLDARRSGDFAQGHVAGAWCVPVWEADVDARITVFEATAGPSSKDPIVIYCSGGDCEDSHMLASRFLKLGYRNLLIYRAGYPDWVEQGHPVQRGEQP